MELSNVNYIELSDVKYYRFINKNTCGSLNLFQIYGKANISIQVVKENYFATIIQRVFRNREICAICQEPVQCGNVSCHHFHKACINSWFLRGNTSCPVCRRPKIISYIIKRKFIEWALNKMYLLRKNILMFDSDYFNDYDEDTSWKRKINLCEYFIYILYKYEEDGFISIEYKKGNLDKLNMFLSSLKTYIEELRELIEDYYSDVNENSILNPSYVSDIREVLNEVARE